LFAARPENPKKRLKRTEKKIERTTKKQKNEPIIEPEAQPNNPS
jgi:hypothetical protein